ncbi:MAG TPA: tetratricopeptide repeat protein, partial [Bacteroidia bacterium]|nr:tetratricopeptide repeat protein [Bacteroidia bacterium]
MKKVFALIFCLFCLFGMLYSQERQYTTHNKKAIKLFEDATKYYDTHQNENAIALLIKAIKEDSNFVEAQFLLGYVYDDMNQYEPAIHQYQEVIRINQNFFPN